MGILELANKVFFNFSTVGSLIPALFFLLTAGFLLRTENKTKATFHLGIVYLLFSLVPLDYFINFAVYDPRSAYTRWISAVISLPASFHLIQFFLYFPENKKFRFSSFLLVFGWIFTLLVWGYYIYATYQSPIIYNFSGHYWDFDADPAQEYIALVILLAVVFFILTALWKIYHSNGKDVWVLAGLLLSAMVITVIPAIANFLSRRGLIERGTYFAYFALLVMIGTFSLIVIYINNKRDKSSFMTKIIGISLVTFFLVLQGVGYFSIRDKEVTFDELKRKDVALTLHQVIIPEDLRYVKYYSLEKDYFISHANSPETNFDMTQMKIEMINSFYYDSLVKLESTEKLKESDEKLVAILSEMPVYLEAYKVSIVEEIKKAREENSDFEIESYLSNLEHTLSKKRRDIQGLKDENFKTNLITYLEKQKDSTFQNFKKSINSYLERSKSEGRELKNEVLWFISILRPSGSRFYRTDLKTGQHFVSYFYSDLKFKRMYEVGFDYLSFRRFVHSTSVRYTLVILTVVCIVLFGFRLFLYGALLKPLDSMIAGVREVNKGDYNVTIPIAVSDELGFLGRSFNRMVRSIRGAKYKLQKHAQELEEKVSERTSELKTTLGEIQELKTHQDGDYFLTSLLIKPLSKNNNKSDRVHVDFIVSQKKKFQFRSYKEEIGGDICVSYNIILRNRPMTVFLNADAMGKSMQGAGGALVLGSVFQSIIQRTKYSHEMQEEYPEKWLKNTFVELHKVFESFKGSMLVSILMGLIDDNTGYMYYVNAEHPYTILYRDGKAGFIETSSLLRKLGTIDMQSSVFVQTFQLKPGDVILSGSDGKDDVFLGVNEEGIRVINEEESWILDKVEKAQGDLKKIYSEITRNGEVTDDLSLVRVEYDSHIADFVIDLDMEEVDDLMLEAKQYTSKKGNKMAIEILERAYKKSKAHIELNRKLINLYLHAGNFRKAAKTAEVFSEIHPEEYEYIYIASFCYKRAALFDKALETAERLKLRFPDMAKNLSNLAEINFYLKDYQRSLEMVRRALKQDPENIRALMIKKKLAKLNIK
ncbi:MAG TPA: SpoIIE family protein phosphatase [Leptospiraceae bacterium]|nr:SpoIIE family protein phosphatase [Leptospiraceae bacterium]HMX34644.1 SpoIIE family protein phosphatase [Leptospiraceae bacterium]HMY34055.1 SpoIIE family protein phosphatase [Leptospiraceae bacterium]HMZ65722.1 SpoIIE family protein phosphatase [Leptospiraceae bacterium]HNA09271.1 SpoIIE family protein phosphatase [Leptospiraceae bacterium]